MSTVLIIEDDLAISRALMINLRAREYRAEHAATGASPSCPWTVCCWIWVCRI